MSIAFEISKIFFEKAFVNEKYFCQKEKMPKFYSNPPRLGAKEIEILI
ncbi:MAG: hypothetical protein LUI14_03185 [Lachnospiraceae bacterium]|nr:hypothetical protein [Lachnospiraceae bacterium]